MDSKSMMVGDEGEMDSLYGSSDSPTGGKKPESVDQEMVEGAQTTVPLSVLTGKDGIAPKEGEERVVKVVKISGDQAVIAYAPEHPKEGEEMPADEELDQMSDKNEGMGY